MIRYLRERNYWWDTRRVEESEKGIESIEIAINPIKQGLKLKI